MSLGHIARRMLGKRYRTLGERYRTLFVDLNRVAGSISPFIPSGAILLDIGGGDGALLNRLLQIRSDLRAKLIDTCGDIGMAVNSEFADRVELYPATSVSEFRRVEDFRPRVILISDVVHHIPCNARQEFFEEVKGLIHGGGEETLVIIKEVDPGHIRARLGLISDRHVSGDSSASLIAREELVKIMKDVFGDDMAVTETELYEVDMPNYAFVFVPDSR